MRLVHKLTGDFLQPEMAGRLGACLTRLLSLRLPVAPGFVVAMAGRPLPAGVADQVRNATAELDAHGQLWVRTAPLAGHGPERWVTVEELEFALQEILDCAPAPSALVVQAQSAACGRGTAVTRDPRRGTVWPGGAFHQDGRTVDLDTFSRDNPGIGVQLRSGLGRIESLYKDVCEVSFCLAGSRLWFDDVQRLRHSDRAAQQLVDIGLRRRREDVLGS